MPFGGCNLNVNSVVPHELVTFLHVNISEGVQEKIKIINQISHKMYLLRLIYPLLTV